jgi:hypothetical protein
MNAKRRQRPKATPRLTKAEEERRVAQRSLIWTRRATILTGLGIFVAIVIAVVTTLIVVHQGSASQPPTPTGIAVNTVPHDQIRGAAIYPVPGGDPSDYLAPGVSLYIDCLQQVRPRYMFARISYGQYKNHWIDVFDIKTPENQDVRYLKPLLPQCHATINLPAHPSP